MKKSKKFRKKTVRNFAKFIAWTLLNEEQCSVRSIYSMIMYFKKSHLIYGMVQVKILWGNCRVEGEKEREGKEKE